MRRQPYPSDVHVQDSKNVRRQPYPSDVHVQDSNPPATTYSSTHTGTTTGTHTRIGSPIPRQRVCMRNNTAHNKIASSLLATKQLQPCRKQYVSKTSQSLQYRHQLSGQSKV